MVEHKQSRVRKVLFIGNYLPRQCGIAAFTHDLVEALTKKYPEIEFQVMAMNDIPEGYAYPERVRFQIDQKDFSAYQSAADFINLNDFDLVCLQHEYGIFGGEAGSFILSLLRKLEIPIVTTLHTILREPDAAQRRVMNELVSLSDRLVVMSERGADYLREIYHVPAEKMDIIPHGIHDVPFVDPNYYKDKFQVEGRPVLLTFGLLSANKGLEYAIRALPAIKKKYPDIAYLCVGATHPHVLRSEGERYRDSLKKLAVELDVTGNVFFYDRFVSLEELVEFIGATDIYLTPYLNRDQITSGTLAYTVGAGKAVISTPYWHAEELLSDGRGVLVPFKDADAIAVEVIRLLEHESERHAIRKRAYQLGRTMIWPKASESYLDSFVRALGDRVTHPRSAIVTEPYHRKSDSLPEVKLDHLLRLTDTTGIFQHAINYLPNYQEGYTTDDNARALITSLMLEEMGEDFYGSCETLETRYLAFLNFAFNSEAGRFRNFLDYPRVWLEDIGSEDSHGRALHALGAVIGRSNNPSLRAVAGRLFEKALPAVHSMTYLRSMTYSLMGISEYMRRFAGDRAALEAGEHLASEIVAFYDLNRTEDWEWFEDFLTYGNATIPHALLMASRWSRQTNLLEIGLTTLRWLVDQQVTDQGHYSFIGNRGFYFRGQLRARFDQQPLEAGTMVSACLEAYRLTGDRRWHADARRAFDWFLGKNDVGLPLYDEHTGGCRDGMHPDRLNQNQGSESLLAYLTSLLDIYLTEEAITEPVKEDAYQKLFRQRS